MTHIELLAPAKDLECGLAAINCGADAVYLGAARFGARENAGNSLDDVEALTRHAHKYWARVYVTVNTLLRDDELPYALRLINSLYEIGVDGLIIQDAALLECELPPIPLIASTQMHNDTPEKVAFLERVGFQRAILARELEMGQIREIRRQTGIELECFIHGSLCVGYSGQCYLSYALGGRSGNRGQCAQPCRKCYSLLDGAGNTIVRDRYLLSLRDLNLSGQLAELIRAGVGSFKIEGRLKDRAYITNVVSYYRRQLDAVLAAGGWGKSSSGTSSVDFEPDPAKTFNRGYTTYFLLGRGAPVASPDTPKTLGEAIGRVVTVTPRSFTIDSTIPLHNADGICFFVHDQLQGTVVNGVQGQTVTPADIYGIAPGTLIYRNHDHAFLTHLAKSRAERLMTVALTLRESPDGFTLIARDEDGNEAAFSLPAEKTPANKPEQAMATIDAQLRKTGGTDFACTEVAIELAEAYFLPVSMVNALRRGALEALTAVREANRPRRQGGAVKNDAPYPVQRLSYTGNVLNRHAAAFYRRHGVTDIEPAAETGLDLRGRKVMTTRHCLKYQLGCCPKAHPGKKLAEPLTLLDEESHRLELRFDCAQCRMEVYYGR